MPSPPPLPTTTTLPSCLSHDSLRAGKAVSANCASVCGQRGTEAPVFRCISASRALCTAGGGGLQISQKCSAHTQETSEFLSVRFYQKYNKEGRSPAAAPPVSGTRAITVNIVSAQVRQGVIPVTRTL